MYEYNDDTSTFRLDRSEMFMNINKFEYFYSFVLSIPKEGREQNDIF